MRRSRYSPVAAGSAVHIAALGTVGYLSFGMIQASLISANNEKFYFRTGLSQPPPNPFGTYSANQRGHPVFWIDADANVAPTKPSGLSPSGSILDLVPTMAVAFVDGTPTAAITFNQYRIQTQRVSDSVSMWDAAISSSSAEKGAAAVAPPYAGIDTGAGHAIPMAHSGLRPWAAHGRNGPVGSRLRHHRWGDNAGRYPITGRITTNQPTFQGGPTVQHIYGAGSDRLERVWGYDPPDRRGLRYCRRCVSRRAGDAVQRVGLTAD